MRPEMARRALSLVLILAGSLLAGCGEEGRKPSPGTEAGSAGAPELPNATLFYPDAGGASLRSCPVFVPPQEGKQQALVALLRRYLAGPACPGSVLPFPEGTRLRAAYLVEGNIAVVDLTSHARSGGGTEAETLRVYGLVDTVAFNHPSLTAVQILVEGQEVDSLTGHLSLSRPLPPDTSLLPKDARESWQRVRGGS